MFRLVIFSCWFLSIFADSDIRPKPSEQRIIGGHDRNITQVPYQVSVRYEDKHKCGGSIIGPRHILTAAHCVDGKNHNSFSIRAGSNYRDHFGEVVKVGQVIGHPYYDVETGNYDAAILVLIKGLKFGEGVQNATLASSEPRTGDIVLISGWGAKEEGKSGSNTLQSVVVPVVSKTICKLKYKWYGTITDEMFCAGYLRGGQDSCHQDSGGPALIKHKLAGIVSWGYGCGRENYPGVYTNILKIKSWILQTMGR